MLKVPQSVRQLKRRRIAKKMLYVYRGEGNETLPLHHCLGYICCGMGSSMVK